MMRNKDFTAYGFNKTRNYLNAKKLSEIITINNRPNIKPNKVKTSIIFNSPSRSRHKNES